MRTRFWAPLLAGSMLMLAAAMPVAADGPHWDYHSHGGGAGWGELLDDHGETAFPDCTLAEQSPVNITGVASAQGGLSLAYGVSDLTVLNNGHAIQVNYGPGSSMTSGGTTYSLLQFHFHSPSEHELDGRQTALEVHFVHQAGDGEYAVLGVMLVAGNHNPTFQQVLDNLPASEGTTAGSGKIDARGLLPESLAYWAYDGSFTTPPCTEGVKWHVLSEPVEVSLHQIEAFRGLEFLNRDSEFVGNARPVQALNGRLGSDAEQAPTATAIRPPSTGSAGLHR